MTTTKRVLVGSLAQVMLLAAAMSPGMCSSQITSFDLVWETVNNTHYDVSFGGVDWKAMHQRYRPQILTTEDIEAFSRITNEMLHQLRLSHLLVASEDMLKTYMPTLFAEGTIGVDIRWLDHRAVISRIRPDSEAQAVGLQTGYSITRIDGRDVAEIVRKAAVMPPYNHRNYRGGVSNYIAGLLDGSPGTSVSIVYRDGAARESSATLMRRSRGAGRLISDAMPPVFVDFESRRLEGDIGYIRFNHFAAPVDTKFISVLADLRDTQGLIFDVRSNPGGYFRIMNTIIEQLISRPTPPYQFKMRDRTVNTVLRPAKQPYRRPVAVLIDVTSTSCSEQFAACLQAIGRAVIVGERSPGYLLGANWLRLPNGLSFMHTILQPIPFGGHIVEGHGVVPDIPVALVRKDLLSGTDSQLEAAVAYILGFKAPLQPGATRSPQTQVAQPKRARRRQ